MKYLVLLVLFFTPFIAKSAAEIGYGTIHGYLPITSQNENEVDRVLSIAMAAQLSGKKIRLYSEASTCQISLISISDTNF